MNCKKCDFEFPCEVKFCPVCGARQTEELPAPEPVPAVPAPQENSTPQQYPAAPPPGYAPPPLYEEDSPRYVGFGTAIALYFRNYVNFRTRSTRSEYWYAYLFTSLIRLCCTIVDFALPVKAFSLIATLTFFLPSLSIAYRRFHDTGRSGTIPLIKLIASGLWSAAVTVSIMLLIAAVFGVGDDDNNFWLVALAFIAALLAGIVPLALNIWQMVICCFASEPKPNKYGREPR